MFLGNHNFVSYLFLQGWSEFDYFFCKNITGLQRLFSSFSTSPRLRKVQQFDCDLLVLFVGCLSQQKMNHNQSDRYSFADLPVTAMVMWWQEVVP